MKEKIKMILAVFLKPLIVIGALFPAKKENKTALAKYRNNITKLRKRGGVYSYKNYKNLPNDSKINLSVIIPIYNVEPYLKECLDSVLGNKTKYHFEIIAINDGSTDGSLNILEKYQDERLKVISTKNGGLSWARNVGLNNAVGEYVTFVDSDDYVTNDYVDALMDAAYKYNADVVRAGYYVLDGEKTIDAHTNKISVSDGLGERVLKCSGFAWGAVIRRELFYGVRFPVGYIFEDMIMRPLILAQAKNYIEIDECVYYYRQRKGSILHQVNDSLDYKCLDQYYLPREIYKYGLKIGVEKRILALIIFRELGLISFMRLRKMNREVRKGVFELNAEFIDKLSLQDDELSDEVDKLYLKCFRKRNYILYVLISIYAWSKR